MANILTSAAITDIRGSMGGLTFSRNAGGAYIRARIKPINPNSARQVAIRQGMAQLSGRWSTVLTAIQRTAWLAYSAATVWTNKLGQVVTITGLAAYLRSNSLLLQAGEALRDDAPTLDGHAPEVTTTILAAPTAQTITVAEPTAGFDADLDDYVLLVFQGQPLSAGSNRIPNRFRFMEAIVGDSVTPPTFPAALAAVFPILDGGSNTAKFVAVDPD
ncbi:MAG TPA: hypothetical protein VMW52_10820, partial [Phycisphaerae bacterium]|nr:hypothetical protein [Phycisphaerae bacterium]